jgi:uncharacterized surface anchored protein
LKKACRIVLLLLLIAAALIIGAVISRTAVFAATGESRGTLLIIKEAEQSGSRLSGAVFGVYRSLDEKRFADLTTNADGEASLALEQGEYYLRELKAPYGYLLEQARICFTIMDGETVIVDVTNERDADISDNLSGSAISIPKTGDTFPIRRCIFGAVLIISASLSAIRLHAKKMTLYNN